MTTRQYPFAMDSAARKWRNLAERRQAHFIELYRTGRWDFADRDRRDGFSVVLFGPNGRRYRHPPRALVEEALRMPGVSSVQVTFHEDRDPDWHAMPPGSTRIICLAGDGSIMQNLQELQTIVGQRIPAKIFLYNNSGYHSIRQSQQAYFDGFSVGCGPDSGVTFPDFEKIATAFGLSYTRVSEHDGMARAVRETLDAPGAALCEIMVDKGQNFAPKVSSRRLDDGTMVTAPMEDLAPFLARDELAEALAVPQ